MNKEAFTAKDILDLYLEFGAMQPDESTWTDGGLRDNPPRFYRFKMLQSLFKAFDLGNLKKFAEGNFVLKRRIEDYDSLIKRMKAELKSVTKFRKGEEITLKEIAFLFKRLLEYRRRWDDVTNFSSGLMACSARYRYAFYKIDQVNSQICDSIAPINDILSFIISTEGKVIDKKELVERFHYPDMDLLDIDVEQM